MYHDFVVSTFYMQHQQLRIHEVNSRTIHDLRKNEWKIKRFSFQNWFHCHFDRHFTFIFIYIIWSIDVHLSIWIHRNTYFSNICVNFARLKSEKEKNDIQIHRISSKYEFIAIMTSFVHMFNLIQCFYEVINNINSKQDMLNVDELNRSNNNKKHIFFSNIKACDWCNSVYLEKKSSRCQYRECNDDEIIIHVVEKFVQSN